MRRRWLSVLLTFLLALPVASAALLSCSASSPDKPRRATIPPAFAQNDIACSVQQRPPICAPPCPVLYDVWLRCNGAELDHPTLTSGNGPSQVVGAGSEISVVTFDPFGTLSSEVALDQSHTLSRRSSRTASSPLARAPRTSPSPPSPKPTSDFSTTSRSILRSSEYRRRRAMERPPPRTRRCGRALLRCRPCPGGRCASSRRRGSARS